MTITSPSHHLNLDSVFHINYYIYIIIYSFRTGVYLMESLSKRKAALKAVESFFTTWALMKAGRMEPGNILTIVLFLFSLIFYLYVDQKLSLSPLKNNRNLYRVSAVIALIFSALYMAVDYPFYISTLTSPLFRFGIITFILCGFVLLFYHLLKWFYLLTGDKSRLNTLIFSDHYSQSFCRISVKCHFKMLSDFYLRHAGLSAFLLCIVCWLPYFLYQYPGVMTPDSLNQFEQVLHVIPYSNHHPWVHTLLIKLFYSIGLKLTGSMLVALSFYTVFQMALLAYSICYFINTLRLFHIRPGICFLITLFYALIPYHAVFSVTLWKDIPFAAAVLCFGCSLLRLIRNMTFKNVSSLCVFILSGFMLCLFRSNGWYAFLLCLPFLLVYFRKAGKIMFPAILGILITSVIIKYPVMNAFHVTQPDLVESLSIPVQQIAAVICNDRSLSDDELALIEKVVDLTYIKDLYDPYYADNIKELVRAGHQNYLAGHKREFLKLWVRLGLRYPADYLTAHIRQTYGYWYPDSFYHVAEAEGVSATSLGVSHTPLIRGPLVIKAKEIAIKMGGMLPLYGTLWSMGVAAWVLIFCVGCAFVRKEGQKLILYLPSLALLFTVLIATPVATEFRYVYFMVFSLPFYLMSALLILPGEV